MKIIKEKLGEGCGKVEWNLTCGFFSLKHNEYNYCNECFNNYKIKEWHGIVNSGLCNGLSITSVDGRKEDINFWIKRSNLFNAFAHCIQDLLISKQTYKYSEKNLKGLAEEGYRKS